MEWEFSDLNLGGPFIETREPGQDWRQTCLEMKNAAEDLAQEILGIAPVIREIQTNGVTKKIGLQYGLR